MSVASDLKKHSEAALTGVGIEAACTLAGRAKATRAYNRAIGDGMVSINEARRLLRETLAIQKVPLDMKLSLKDGTGQGPAFRQGPVV